MNHATRMTVTVENEVGNTMEIAFRAYNDGVAYRYLLSNENPSTVSNEISGFQLPRGSLAWAMSYRRDNEGFYLKQKIDTMKQPIYAMPMLFQTPGHQFILIHEADVLSKYCASSLTYNHTDHLFHIAARYPEYTHGNENYKNTFEFILENESLDIRAEPGFTSPWRVVMASGTLKPIVESTLIENLCPPPAEGDYSWIKPGVAAFPWWGDNHANGDTMALKRYIDMAAAMNWTFIEFDVALVGSPSFAVDRWKTTPWVKGIVQYAESKEVSVYGWDERRNLNTPEKRAEIFGRYRDMGIKGIKIDFINSNNQEAMAFREACLRDALKYGLLVSFHGETTPRGERRTYPNLVTQEGIKGSEYYLFAGKEDMPNPVHNCTVPFTRNVVGPMDYTPVAFSTKNRITTYAHELALSVVVESGWQCMCDKPEFYLQSPAADFLKQLVSVWDETRFLRGYPGEYFCIARRHGNHWFVAGINAARERTVKLDLNFMKSDAKNAKLYFDGENSRETCTVKEISVSNTEPLEIKMAENGGFAMIITM